MTLGLGEQGNMAEGGGDQCRYGGRTCGGLGCWLDAGLVVEDRRWIAATNAHPMLHPHRRFRSLANCAIDLGKDPKDLNGREQPNRGRRGLGRGSIRGELIPNNRPLHFLPLPHYLIFLWEVSCLCRGGQRQWWTHCRLLSGVSYAHT